MGTALSCRQDTQPCLWCAPGQPERVPAPFPGGVTAAGALQGQRSPVLGRKVSQTGVVIEATAHTKRKAERRTWRKC